ncbi:DUF4229 domain-containing protein [Nocardioides mangrovicus]|uniref:DUF4229 domain-containing protein n=1 Tax=Nocardioides mangrovicus TaxID=2478913 RepID=A0A3L8P6A2_9ACTN|nr:DUF4229 domain-containing protein [Nocardioides mangrovicus]RLV50502.1 DUF4229 domain-containing protein [Nocardioides mangrovicus]
MRDFWVYNVLRIALFLATAAVVWGIFALFADETINLVLVAAIAAVVSAVLSWRLLAGPRERAASAISGRASRMTEAFEERRAREDAESASGEER